MIQMFEAEKKDFYQQSSEGNQLKWYRDGIWYKADSTGYEGLVEYMISHLLKYSTLGTDEYVIYDLETVAYKRASYNVCCSRNFLPEGWQIITLERLFKSVRGQELGPTLVKLHDHKKRLSFLVKQIEQITNMCEFGRYMSILLTVDTLFLNEDRHMHNIAVLLDPEGKYHLCPIFDNGAALLADTTIDYPLLGDIYEMIDEVRSKTCISMYLDEQLDIAEELYGVNIKFSFGEKEINELLLAADQYAEDIRIRVKTILLEQRRKYQYLFEK